ncbi:hypothetical protein KJ632_04020 [Patescibacteria group bacterium]|nr:hypothetical protein [Patescibacteria group bacterium]
MLKPEKTTLKPEILKSYNAESFAEDASEVIENSQLSIVKKKDSTGITDLLYIIDENGTELTGGYESFEWNQYDDGDRTTVLVIGKRGGQKQLLILPETPSSDSSIVLSQRFHDLYFRQDLGNIFLAKCGGLSHILDPQTGKLTANGYHKYFMRSGKLIGRLGVNEDEIYRKSAKEAFPPDQENGEVHNLLGKISDYLKGVFRK